jgi:hypothetical protein
VGCKAGEEAVPAAAHLFLLFAAARRSLAPARARNRSHSLRPSSLPPPSPLTLNPSPGTFTVVDTPSTDALPYGPEADAIRAHFPHTWGKPPVRLVRAPPAHGAADGSLGDPCRLQLRVGIVLSGGQAPGGHNVIGGLLDALMHRHPGSRLFGFLDGPRGILERNYKEITVETMVRKIFCVSFFS